MRQSHVEPCWCLRLHLEKGILVAHLVRRFRWHEITVDALRRLDSAIVRLVSPLFSGL